MKKNILKIFLIMTMLSSCNNKSTENASTTSSQEVDNSISKIVKTESGKVYYSIDNKPFMPIGVQIRTDLLLYAEKQDMDVIEDRFTRAKNLGVNVVEIPIPWNSCETSKDTYNFRDLGKMLTIASNLDLKVEILTFGTNTTGWSNQVPDYIKQDSNTYPRYNSHVSPSSYFLVQNDPDLLEREGKWINAMMDAISSWSKSNNNKHVVSAIQVHNEADTFPRFVLTQQEIYTVDNSRRLTDIEAWKETYEAYDYLGKVVKNSSYKCITRVNVAQAYKGSWTSFVPDIYDLEGIDIIGDDTYEKTVSFNKNVILDFNNEDYFVDKNNYAHISENDGSYNTTPSLILATTAIGGGYMIYDLATPEIALDDYGWDDWSIIDSRTLEDKAHTELTRQVIKGINLAGSDYILANQGNIAAFNVKENVPQQEKTQTIQTSHAVFNFTTTNGALGYAISNEKFIDMFVTAPSTITISNVNFEKTLYEGKVDLEGNFTSNSSTTIEGNTINLEANRLYRLNVNSIDGNLKSNAIKNIG